MTCTTKKNHSGRLYNYAGYESKRRQEGKWIKVQLKKLKQALRIMLKGTPLYKLIPYILCLIDKEFRGNSYRQHVSYMEQHEGTRNIYGLKQTPGKSCLHAIAVKLSQYLDMFYDLLATQLNTIDTYGTLLGDSSGFAINTHTVHGKTPKKV